MCGSCVTVYLTKVITQGAGTDTLAYDDIRIKGRLEFTIHPNLNKLKPYPCTPDHDLTASLTDIVVSTLSGSVRLGEKYHIMAKGNVVVEFLCVVYTAGEDPDQYDHGTCIVASNFIQPNARSCLLFLSQTVQPLHKPNKVCLLLN